MNSKFIVPYETAKLLKERGYNEKIPYAYNRDKQLVRTKDCDNTDWDNLRKVQSIYPPKLDYIAAPTYHEVLDWLESKNELLGIETLCGINASTKQRHYYVKISIGDCKPEPYDMRVDVKSKTYRCEGLTREEALNAAILKALEMIV